MSPLEGVKVLELSGGIATRYCARLFAMLGADVVRVEGGDDARIGYGGSAGEAFGAWLDQNKRAARTPADARAMLGQGLSLIIAGQDHDAVAAAQDLADEDPDAPLLLGITWFADIGPYANWTPNDPVLQALSGGPYSFGLTDQAPTTPQGHGPQIATGVTAFLTTIATLIGRRRGSGARRIDMSIHEAGSCFYEPGGINLWTTGGRAVRLGINRMVPTYPCSVYRTSDGWVGVTALTPAQWAALCVLAERPELGTEPKYATTYERLMLSHEVDAVLAPAFAKRTSAEWLADGDANRIPMAPALDQAGLLQAEHWRARESFVPIGGKGGGKAGGLMGPRLPFRLTFDGARRAMPDGPARPTAPLAGFKVLDFSMGWAGPLATRHLGDLGAEVVKIESDAFPDWWRGWEAVEEDVYPPPRESRFHFIAVNRNKRDVALDLRAPEGRAAINALIARSDVVIENFGPGVLSRLGYGPKDQRALRPGVVSVSMGPFGQGGPWAGLRAYGSTVEQASGLPFANGQDDWPPGLQHNAYGDPVAGLYAASAALAVLYGRERLGGAEVDLSQVECLFQFGADPLLARQLSDAPLKRTGTRRATAAPCCNVRAAGADEWLNVCVDRDEAWPALCGVIGRPEWAADPAFATIAARNARADEIEAAITAWSRNENALDAAHALQLLGVPAAPVLRADQLAADPQLWAGGYWQTQERRYVGRHLQAAPPYRVDGERPPLVLPAPTIGEHTDEVLAELKA